MKIFEAKPEVIVRLQIQRKGDENEYLALCDTTIEEVKDYIQDIMKDKMESIGKYKTSVYFRETVSKKSGSYSSISFYGPSPREVKETLVSNLKTK